jgi:antitoxin CptB
VPAERGQLAWRCRRGMKELDLLLVRYLDQRWPVAAAAERAAFELFLELPDPEIAAYLLGGVDPPDAGSRELVEALRRAAPRPAAATT